MYAHDEDDLYLTFYANSSTEVELGGTMVGIQQKTDYPSNGKIDLTVHPAQPKHFRLWLQFQPGHANSLFLDLYIDISMRAKSSFKSQSMVRRYL